jgi:hypothetical protein
MCCAPTIIYIRFSGLVRDIPFIGIPEWSHAIDRGIHDAAVHDPQIGIEPDADEYPVIGDQCVNLVEKINALVIIRGVILFSEQRINFRIAVSAIISAIGIIL